MSKSVKYGEEARKLLMQGAKAVCDAVATTLGPKGRNATICQKYGAPLVTNDGVTIAKELEVSDPFLNAGALLIKQASIKTNDIAGDGTTTACVLAGEIIKEGFKVVSAGSNPMFIRKGIEKACKYVCEKLKEQAIPVKTTQEIEQVASISGGSEDIGEIISKAYDEVGEDGIITVEEGNSAKTELNIVKGMQFDRGYISPYFCTDMEKMTAEINDCFVFLTDKSLSNVHELLPLLEKVASEGGKLLLIADEIEGEALSLLILNKMRGNLNCVCSRAPLYGDKRKALLSDIAVVTGGKVFDSQTGDSIKDAFNYLGKAKKIIVTANSTTIIDGEGDAEALSTRIESIKNSFATAEEYDKSDLRKRIASLTGGVAVIKTGGATEIEMKERKMRLEDAISAVRSAKSDGIIAGGGSALAKASLLLMDYSLQFEKEERTGIEIVAKSLVAPLKQIAENAGQEGGIVVQNVLSLPENIGYNAIDNSYPNMLDSGIIDPTFVTISALINACSVAGSVLTTETLIAEVDSKQ